MNFENPVWLYWTPLIVLTIAGLIAFGLRRRDVLLRQFAAARLLDQLTKEANLQRILIKAALILLAGTLICMALARPQYGVDFVERKTRGLDIVFVLDSSRSMLATDLRPTRLERAKLAMMDLVKRLESDRVGLVVFAGNAFLQTPPTLDYSAFRENLNAVGPSSLSRGGSDIGQALQEAVKAFPKDDNFKVVILLTDGEDLEEQAIDTARKIAADGIKVYSIGIGTPEGAYLKVRTENGTEEFIRDSSGQPVRSRLDETTLQKISQLTGGSYSRLAGQSLERLYTSVLATLPREERESELQETRTERYQWALFGAILCLVIELLIRRRKTVPVQTVTALILLQLIIPTPSPGEEIIQEFPDEPEEAIASENSSDDPRVIYNQAYASLIEGNYTEALELYKTAIEYSDDIELEHKGLYNMAHASNQLGEEALQEQDFETAVEHWKQAEALFKSAHELVSSDAASLEDARQMEDRRKALEEFLDQQKSQEQQQNSPEQQENNNEQNQQDSKTESGQNNQSNEPSSDDSSDEKSDSQSGETASEQEPSDAQKTTSSAESSDAADSEDKESNQSDNEAESSEDTHSEESINDQKSTANPTEDMQEQREDATSGEDDDNESETKKNEAVQETSGEKEDSEGTKKAIMVPEGMDISDAQQLLDSLRSSERLLPFTEPSDKQGQKRETRDW